MPLCSGFATWQTGYCVPCFGSWTGIWTKTPPRRAIVRVLIRSGIVKSWSFEQSLVIRSMSGRGTGEGVKRGVNRGKLLQRRLWGGGRRQRDQGRRGVRGMRRVGLNAGARRALLGSQERICFTFMLIIKISLYTMLRTWMWPLPCTMSYSFMAFCRLRRSGWTRCCPICRRKCDRHVLGFGKSPRPEDSFYTNAEHVDMIRRSVLKKYGIREFHLVAHSMGCTIALALAGNDPAVVKSITILAPLYFPTRPGVPPASYVLSNVAPQKIWPFFAFLHSIMSWYEHLGRVACLVFCKHHRFWIPLMTLFAKRLGSRMPPSFIHDYMQHSHSSAFKMLHNTICAGPFVIEHSLKQLERAGKHVHVIHGEADATCSVEGGVALSRKFSNVTLSRIPGADHMSVVLGREQELAQELDARILAHYRMEPHAF